MPACPRTALLAAGLLLAGCAEAGGNPRGVGLHESTEQPRIVGDWVLIAGTVDGQPFPFPPEGPAGTLGIDEAYMGGTFFCNRVGGSYRLVGDRLELGEVESTLIACSDDVMRAESAYYRVFAAEDTRVSRRGEELVLTNDVGELRFRGGPPVPGTWAGRGPDEATT